MVHPSWLSTRRALRLARAAAAILLHIDRCGDAAALKIQCHSMNHNKYLFLLYFLCFSANGIKPSDNALVNPDTREKLAADNTEPVSNATAVLKTFIREEIAKWAKVIRAAEIVLN